MKEYDRSDFAGFWTRFIAFILDVIFVSIIVFPFALVLGIIAPNSILVEVPFDLFTTTTTIFEVSDDKNSIEKDEVLGLLTNYYKIVVSEESNGEESISRNLIEPIKYLSINKTTSSDIEFYVIFIYWIIFEASIWQASIGKKIMGLKVVNKSGGKPNIFQCISRNLLKILSGMIIFVGFMMAGWTNKKQALHDIFHDLLVVKDSRKN